MPGESTLWFSVTSGEQSEDLARALRDEQVRLPPGERLHVAILPTETFF